MADAKDQINTIQGTTEVTIKIRDLKSLDEIAKQVAEKDGLAEKIVKIDIKTYFGDDEDVEFWLSVDKVADETIPGQATEIEEKDQEELSDKEKRIAKWNADEKLGACRASVLCTPIINILSTIISRGCTLKHFSWYASYYGGTRFTRPQSFWDALFAHSATIENMRLDYFEHEVLHIRAPNTTFPALKKLILDTSSAHGDEGAGIDALLKSCPNLEWLEFSWPGCDLDDCQIQNISWEYTYHALTRLELNGYNFATAPLAAFLSRHPLVETLYDGFEWDANSDSKPKPLKHDDLPKLKVLLISKGRHVQSYFDDAAHRPLRHLCLHSSWGLPNKFIELTKLPIARTELRVLELDGTIGDWRVEEEEEEDDSSDTEDGEERKQKPKHDPPPLLRDAMKAHLAEFKKLQEVGISLETGTLSMTRPDGTWGNLDAATGEDVKFLLTYIPPTSRIRALRAWDSCAEPLAQEFLNDFPSVPDSLEYFEWEGKDKDKKSLYKLVRENGKIRAEVCEKLRGSKREEEEMGQKNWTEERVLDY